MIKIILLLHQHLMIQIKLMQWIEKYIKKPTRLRWLSTLSTHNTIKQPSTKYFIRNTDDKIPTTTNRPMNYSVDSVFNFTLELEQRSTDDIQRRHTISTNDIDPLLLNRLTDEENQLNLIEKTNEYDSSMNSIDDNSTQ